MSLYTFARLYNGECRTPGVFSYLKTATVDSIIGIGFVEMKLLCVQVLSTYTQVAHIFEYRGMP